MKRLLFVFDFRVDETLLDIMIISCGLVRSTFVPEGYDCPSVREQVGGSIVARSLLFAWGA